MDLHFLQARYPLTKTFELTSNGDIEVASYPNASEFKSHHERVNSIKELYIVLNRQATLGHCLLKGNLTKPLNFESRAGSTDPFAPTQLLVLDIDGLVNHEVSEVLFTLGIKNVDHIIQYSSSQGVTNKLGLSCHVFLHLSRPTLPTAIKQWLIKKNLDLFQSQIYLTRSFCALHYPIDITACQNDKLIYIAPPICKPPELDKFSGQRIQLITSEDSKATFDFPEAEVPAEATNRIATQTLVNHLRKQANLPERKSFEYKSKNDQEYLPKPDAATVTGVREARGFTYLNVNGGNSWGYWHPTDKAEFIYNFKGEPVYRTAEFLPSYYSETQRKREELNDAVASSRKYVAFRDFASATYYNGYVDKATGEVAIYAASSKTQLTDFLSDHGIKPPKTIPDWTCTFDPSNPVQIDTDKQIWNRFKSSSFMHDRPVLRDGETKQPPNTILAVINHVLGGDINLIDAFLNWCAYAFQKRKAAGTAWMLQGVPGTGKGILVHQILKPIFGASNTTSRRMEELEDKFNGYMEGCLLCYIDEVNIGVSKRADMIMANLKNQITEPLITIRNMRQTAYESPNYLNWIFSSNMAAPIDLDREDRRFNVGAYQTKSLRSIYPDTAALIQQISQELEAFADFLYYFHVDEDRVRVPIKNDARQQLIENSLSSLDIVGEAIMTGDLETLLGFVSDPASPVMAIKADAYKALIADLVKTRRDKLTRDELYTIFDYTVGNVPESPAKFARFLSHRNIKLKKIRVGLKTARGIDVIWNYNPEWLQDSLDVLPLVQKAHD